MKKGTSLIEVLVYLAIFVILFIVIISFIFWLVNSNAKARADRETADSAARILKILSNEIMSAKSIYEPTTSANQLSLETEKYISVGEERSYIDFFLCGTSVCFKKEFAEPSAINSDNIEIQNIIFEKVSSDSVKIIISARYKTERPEFQSEINLETSACIRD